MGSAKELLGQLDKDSFVALLSKVIGESKYVQNNPPELIPEEDRVARHILDALLPYSTTIGGGPLIVNHVTYVQGRGNVIVEYPGIVPGKILSFVGCHMDVITVNPDEWDFDPFSLSIDGDRLCGRGTIDCLGHVALVTELMRRLGETKPKLNSTVVAVFANEENSSISGVGVDELVKHGLLNKLKQGPLYWIDTADKQPCIGTGGMIAWKLRTTGKLFHSGLAHKAINPLELSMGALKEIQQRFYTDSPPPHPKEQVYKFATPSTMKPTQWSYPGGGINQIPYECTISGDVQVNVRKKLQEYVDDINDNIEKLDTQGPVSKYVLPEENIRGRLTISFDDDMISGVACDLDSHGFHVLCKATEEVVGYVKPYSITGSLPLIRKLQDEGFDVQTTGYGLMATYHAKNEYCLLCDMCQGFEVFVNIISQLEDDTS